MTEPLPKIGTFPEQVEKKTQGARNNADALQVVTHRLPGPLIKVLDCITAEKGYYSRSELIRELLTLSLSGRTFEFQKMEQAAQDLFSPILPRLSELITEIFEEIPKQKLLELAILALIPFAQFMSLTMGIPVEEVEKYINESLTGIIE